MKKNCRLAIADFRLPIADFRLLFPIEDIT